MPRVLPFEHGLPDLQLEYSVPGSSEDPALDKLIKTIKEAAQTINKMKTSQIDTSTAAHGSFPLTMAHSQTDPQGGSAEAFDEQVLIIKLAFLQVAFMEMGIDPEHGKDGANFRTITHTLLPLLRPLIKANILSESVFFIHENAGEFAVQNDLLPYLVSERNPYLEAYLLQDAKASANRADEKQGELSQLLLECYKATAKCLHYGLDQHIVLDLNQLMRKDIKAEIEQQQAELRKQAAEVDDNVSQGEEYADEEYDQASFAEEEHIEQHSSYPFTAQEVSDAIREYVRARTALTAKYPALDKELATKLQAKIITKTASFKV